MPLHKVGGQTRAYGHATIKRIIQQQKSDPAKGAHTSIADKPHANNREAERRRRQAERKAAKTK